MSPDEISGALSGPEGNVVSETITLERALVGDVLLSEIIANGGRVPRNRAERRAAMSRARRAVR